MVARPSFRSWSSWGTSAQVPAAQCAAITMRVQEEVGLTDAPPDRTDPTPGRGQGIGTDRRRRHRHIITTDPNRDGRDRVVDDPTDQEQETSILIPPDPSSLPASPPSS